MGPCADKRVTCTIVTKSNHRYVGENWCAKPQRVCPRKPGENYDKCIMVCGQPGHAENMALIEAGEAARGAVAYLEGIDWCCVDCQNALHAAGVVGYAIGPTPFVGHAERVRRAQRFDFKERVRPIVVHDDALELA